MSLILLAPAAKRKSAAGGHGWSGRARPDPPSPGFRGRAAGQKSPVRAGSTPGAAGFDGGRAGANYNNPRRFPPPLSHSPSRKPPPCDGSFRCVTSAVCLVALTASAEEKFVPLFNGTNLDGWEGDPELWHVDGGAIVGSTEKKQTHRQFVPGHQEELQEFRPQGQVQAPQP